jgi:hypothetical protein
MKPLLLSLFSLTLTAHDLYLMPKTFAPAPGAILLLSAHTGDSFPASEQPVDPARLTSMPPTEWRILGKATHSSVTVQPGSQYFAVHTAPRSLSMEPAAFRAYLKEEGLTAAFASYGNSTTRSREMYSKFAKTYVVAGQPTPDCHRPLGLKIEFVLLAEPTTTGKLPVELRFDGKPLPDVQVEIATSHGHRIAGRTNAQGRLEIKLDHAGPTRLHAVHMVSVQADTHDWESFWASLTFTPQPGR